MGIELVDKKDVKIKRSVIEHHTKYNEIHGEDKTIFIARSEHVKLHRRLRREGRCNVPPDELDKMSGRACHRKKSNFMKEVDKRVKERVLGIKPLR